MINQIEIKKAENKKPLNKITKDLPEAPFRMVIAGPSNSGKTHLLVDIMTRKNGYSSIFMKENIIIFSSTYGLDDKFMKIKHEPSNVFNKFDPDIVEEIFKQQIAIKMSMPKRIAPVLIIFEDMASEQIFNRSKLMESLAFKSRHLQISFIILTQKYTSISTSLRRNADVTILLSPRNFAELDTIVEENFCKEDRKKAKNLMKDIFKKDFNNIMITYKRNYPKYKKNLTEVINIV